MSLLRLGPSQLFSERWIVTFAALAIASVIAAGSLLAINRRFDQQSWALLEQSHDGVVRLVARDIDDLRHQLVQIYGPASEAHFQNLIFQTNSSGMIGVRGSYPLSQWTPIVNAGDSVFRAALPRYGNVRMEILADRGEIVDHNVVRVPRGPAFKVRTPIDGTNLSLRSSLAKGPNRISYLVIFLFALLGGGTIGVLVHWGMRGPMNEPEMRPMVIRPVIPTMPADSGLMAKAAQPKAAVRETHDSAVAIQMVTWQVFLKSLEAFVSDLQLSDSVIVARVQLASDHRFVEFLSLLSRHLQPYGRFLQSCRRRKEVYFVLRVGFEGKLFHVIQAIRHLAFIGLLKPGNFKINMVHLFGSDKYKNPSRIIDHLSSAGANSFQGQSASNPSLAPHLCVHQGWPAERIMIYNFDQILALQTFQVMTTPALVESLTTLQTAGFQNMKSTGKSPATGQPRAEH